MGANPEVVEVDLLQRVNDVFRDLFEADDLTVDRHTTAADVPGWDSLMHVRLMLAVEKAFQVRFSSAEVAGLGNVGALVDLLNRKTARQAGA
jgi:acyl carrier protein